MIASRYTYLVARRLRACSKKVQLSGLVYGVAITSEAERT
jgi:hypothetical protein